MYNVFNVRRDVWEIGRLNLRDAATERRTTIPYREEISHSAMSGSFSFVDQIYKMKEIKEFKIIPLNQILLDSSLFILEQHPKMHLVEYKNVVEQKKIIFQTQKLKVLLMI